MYLKAKQLYIYFKYIKNQPINNIKENTKSYSVSFNNNSPPYFIFFLIPLPFCFIYKKGL